MSKCCKIIPNWKSINKNLHWKCKMKYSRKFLSKYKDDVWDLNIQILEWQNNLHIKSFENMQNVGAQTNSGRNRIGANRLRVNHAPVPHSNNTIRTRHVGLGCVFTDFGSNVFVQCTTNHFTKKNTILS